MSRTGVRGSTRDSFEYLDHLLLPLRANSVSVYENMRAKRLEVGSYLSILRYIGDEHRRYSCAFESSLLFYH